MKTKLLTAGLAILLIVTAFQTVRIERHKANYAKLEAEYAGYKEEQARVILELGKAHREEIEQIRRDGDETLIEVQTQLNAVSSDVNGLRSENARLRAARNPTAASQCKTEYGRISVLSIVSDECSEQYTEMARIAQESRVRGQVCEMAYDVLARGKGLVK